MKWIKYSERLPEDGQYILVVDEFKDIWTASYKIEPSSKGYPDGRQYFNFKVDNDSCCACTWPTLDIIIHWMPLPDLPKD